MAVLTQQEIAQLVYTGIKDPFIFLGQHKINDKEFVIRAIQPAADKIEIVSKKLKHSVAMNRIHSDGLYEAIIEASNYFDYELKITYHTGDVWTVRDPYNFSPVLSEYDTYLFNEGNHHRIYEKMGAHIIKHDNCDGTHFSVWAPEAVRVSVVGNFNSWDGRVHQMRMLGSSGVWEIFIPKIGEGELYRFEIKTKFGSTILKSDPYAFLTEVRPANSSIVYKVEDKHSWKDSIWMNKRENTNWLEKPVSVYEVHLGSWMRKGENGKEFLTYSELAEKLTEYVKNNNYTHIELMPVAEHPLDESWGYQVTGYFSATSRFGNPEELMYLIDKLHQNDIGVILDWVPGHFPKDAHGLGRFDGTAVYEHMDPKQGEHTDWGTYIFNYGRNEVKNFLITNALYWLDKFHIDGLRVDAVASMLYLDYSRKSGEWIPNKFGGRENLEAVEFLKYFNTLAHQYYPGILTIAEESTAWGGVSKPVYLGGLGFSMKWNMGWMNDSLEYIQKDSIYRKYHQNSLTFSLMYAFSENFMLVLSHDEVVHGKKSIIDKMPGEFWQKFANLRLFTAYSYAHPGKKLMFMGQEIGQWKEWNCKQSLDWHLTEYEPHSKIQGFISDLNKVYKENPALWEIDFNYEGFEWIDFRDSENGIISFVRKGKEEEELMVCIFNFTPIPRQDYRIGVPKSGYYKEVLNSDSDKYWGSNVGNYGGMWAENIPWQGKWHSMAVTIPPLGALFFKLTK